MGLIRLISRLPFPLWFIIAAGLCYMDYADWEANIYKPALEQVELKKTEITAKERQVARAEEFQKRREEKLRELQALGEKLSQGKSTLPQTPDIPGLLKSLANISDQTGLEFSRFKPEGETKRRFLVETRIAVNLKGTYVQIMSFLDSAANLQRAVGTEKLTLESPPVRGSVATLNATATLVAYHLDPSGGQ